MFGIIQKYRFLEYVSLFLISLIFICILLYFAIDIAPYLAIGICVFMLAVYSISRINGGFILAYLLISITFLENNPGVQIIEIPFYVFSVVLIFYNIVEILRGNFLLNTYLDKIYLLVLLLIPYGIAFGILNGSSLYLAFGETTYLLGIFLYFPLRNHLSNSSFKKIVYAIILVIVIYVLIRNFINYRQIIIQAVASWQAEKARVPSNEFIIMFGALLFMAAALTTKIRMHQLLFTFLFLALLSGLILTQSRGYWLAFFIGTTTIFFLADLNGKIRMTYTFLILAAISVILAQLFFYDQFYLILNGLSARFDSILDGKLDVSLYERLLESQAVLKEIFNQPISGYGMGVTYTKQYVFDNFYADTSYVHNGYLGTWFKFGIIGLFIFPLLWVSLIINSARILKTTQNTTTKIVMFAIAATVSGVLLVNNTSPQVFNFTSSLFITIFSAIISTLNEEKYD